MFRVSAGAACLAAAALLVPNLANAQSPRQGAERRGFEQRADPRGRPDVGDRYFHDERRGQAIWERLGELKAKPRVEREVITIGQHARARGS